MSIYLLSILNQAIYEDDIVSVERTIATHPNLLKRFADEKNRNRYTFEDFESSDGDDIYQSKDYEYFEKNPLHVALEKGSVECIKFMLEKGAKLEGRYWKRFSTAEYLFKNRKIGDRKEILELLLKFGLDTKYRSFYKKNNLLNIFISYIKSTTSDAVGVIEALLNAGLPIDETNHAGHSPLEQSISINHQELANFLIKKGATDTGDELMCAAAQYNMVDTIDLLLSNGANVNARSESLYTALHYATMEDNEEATSLLVRKGADLNVVCGDGETPFEALFSYIGEYAGFSEKIIVILVKEFAKLSFQNRYISKQNADVIEYPKVNEIFKKCMNELSQMASTEFHAPYSFFSVINMKNGSKKLANLTKNSVLASRFVEYLEKIFYYKSNLQEIWNTAVIFRVEFEEVYSRLNCIFHNYLPSIVIRILSENLNLENLPLE